MQGKYLLMGRDEDNPARLHMEQFDSLEEARREARRKKYLTDKRIYSLQEVFNLRRGG